MLENHRQIRKRKEFKNKLGEKTAKKHKIRRLQSTETNIAKMKGWIINHLANHLETFVADTGCTVPIISKEVAKEIG